MKTGFFTRIFLLIATNIAVLAMIAVVVRFTGLDVAVYKRTGLNYEGLLIMSALMGFGGAFISLAMSRIIAKWSTGAELITNPSNETERWLVSTIAELAQKAGIAMPQVAVFPSPDPNAFATGPTRNRSLVAVSTGLMHAMNKEEIKAVLGHEIAHVANGDMITMTLLQGVLNTFVIFFSRIVGYLVDGALRGNNDRDRDRGPGIGYFIASMAAQIVFGMLASVILAWFSRRREFRADAGSAELYGTMPMVRALEKLKRAHDDRMQLPESLQAFGIKTGRRSGIAALFSTHPPLDERIAALKNSQVGVQ